MSATLATQKKSEEAIQSCTSTTQARKMCLSPFVMRPLHAVMRKFPPTDIFTAQTSLHTHSGRRTHRSAVSARSAARRGSMRKLLAPEVEDHGWQRSAAMPPDPPAHGGEHSCRCAQLGASAGAGGAAKGVRAPAERPQNMPITPHESIAGTGSHTTDTSDTVGGWLRKTCATAPPKRYSRGPGRRTLSHAAHLF